MQYPKRTHSIYFFIIYYIAFFILTFICPPPSHCESLWAASHKEGSPRSLYSSAWKAYKRLARSPRLRKDRRAWMKVINEFRKLYLAHADNPVYAPKALYMMARIYRELYGYSGKKADLKNALKRYEVLFERFPQSSFADDALYGAAIISRRLGDRAQAEAYLERIILRYPGSDIYRRAERRLGKKKVEAIKKRASQDDTVPPSVSLPQKSPYPLVTNIRHWTEKDYTRVVIELSKASHYHEGYLPPDKRKHLPRRLYLDITPARVASDLSKKIVIGNGLLKRVRVGQFNRDSARVVFDLGKTSRTKVFNLDDPFRIVVDAFGESYTERITCPPPKGKLTIAQQLGLCVRRIVVDAGHGGHDPGAIGPTGLREKDIALKVAKLVKNELKKRLGAEVILTRSRDVFLPLEQRTAIANAKKADLFVSIHCNAAPNRRLAGVETYFLNFALDEEAMRVAALENATSKKRVTELKSILSKLLKNTKVAESKRLAEFVQKGLVHTLKKRYSSIHDLGVKQAPFFVLIGARMPSVLTEISFISNRREERRLRSPQYLKDVARGIAAGIEEYVKNTELIAQAKVR